MRIMQMTVKRNSQFHKVTPLEAAKAKKKQPTLPANEYSGWVQLFAFIFAGTCTCLRPE